MLNPIIQQLFYGLIAITLGYYNFKVKGLILAYFFANIFTLINMRRKTPLVFITINIQDIIYTIKKNWEFVKFQSISNLISSTQSQFPIFIIKILWGDSIVGLYSMAVKILKAPVTFIAKAIGRVFFQIISEFKLQGKDFSAFAYKNIINNLYYAIFPLSLIIAFGDIIVALFLGEEWIETGNYLKLLGIQYYFVFITGSIQGLSIILKKQKYAMIVNLAQMLVYVVSFMSIKFGLMKNE